MSFLDKIRSLFVATPAGGGGSAVPAISCEKALSVVHDFLDGELEGVSHAQVKAHFDVCKRCYPHFRPEGRYRQVIRRSGPKEQAPAGLKVKLMELLAEADA
jgi:mycothiol system anti-sigma-R factor